MPLPSGFKIDSQERKFSIPAGFVFDEPDDTKQSSYAAPKGFILDEITESSPSLKQGQPPTMFERGKEAVSDIFRKDPGLGPLTEEDYAAFKPADISMSKKEKDRQEVIEQKSPGLLTDSWGLRADGTKKGPGFLGPLQRPDGKVSTELSVGVNLDGKEIEIPTLVPTLEQSEIDYLLSGGKPTDAIIKKAVEHAKMRIREGKSPFADIQDLRQQEYGTAMTRPISTITGKPVPTPEEKAAGGKAAMALAPYGFASAVRGMIPEALEKAIMQPITKATIGREYVSPIDEALKASGKYLPEGAQKVVGTPARMAGAVVPLNISFKTANAIMKAAGLPTDLVLSTGPVVDQIAGHIARGGLAGAIYGALEEGTPEGMAEDAAFFGALEGGLGAAGKIFEKIFSSNWYRNLEVPERGLVVQTADDLRRAGHSEGTILRTLSDPVERKRLLEEATKKRMAPERPSVDLTVNKKRFEENPLDAENNAEYLNKYIEKAKQPKPPAISPPEEILPIESKLTHRALPLKPEEEPPKEIKMKKASEKIKAETPTMLKESDKVNDVTLEVLVDMAAKDPAKALEHAEEATVSKARLIEGLKNKGLKAMGEAKSKEERAEIAKNLEETLRGIEGEIKPKIESGAKKEPKSGQKATPITSKVESKGKQLKTTVTEIPTSEIHSDPDRFQYKRFLGKEGVSPTLKEISKYDEELGGIISVWRDPADGKTYVVNGHHRLELARRTGQETLTVRYLDARTAEDAKRRGALINIAEGQGKPEDAAVVFRSEGMNAEDLQKKYHISLKGKLAKEGLALSKLHPTIFNSVERGEIPQNWGVVIGEHLENQDMQLDLIRYLDKIKRSGKTVNAGVIEQLIKDVKGETVGKVKAEEVGLFGKESFERPLLMERAELRDYAINELAKEKRLFGAVGKESAAKRLVIGGNVINVKKSQSVAEKAALAKDIFERLAGSKGEISDELNKYAKELSNAKGKGERDRIKRDFLERLRETVDKRIIGAEGRGVEGGRRDAKTGIVTGAEGVEERGLFGERVRPKKEPWETSDLADTPNLSIHRITAKKQANGKFKLFYTGTSNEIFGGKEFKSAPEARMFFKAQQIKAQEASKVREKEPTLKEPEPKYATKPKYLTEKELLEKKRLFQEYGAKTKGNKVILYRGGDVPKSQLRNLRYGDYLSASGKGPDITGNEGADAYGKNVVRFELPIIDIEVTGAGEFQYKGKAASLKKGGRKYPVTIYKAYNDYYGSNFTAEEIDKEDDVRKVASMALSGGREEFDALMAEYQAIKEPEARYAVAESEPFMYSALTRAAESPKFPAKLPAKSVINYLKKAPGVKQSEIDAVGLAEWLEGKEKVSKDELVKFLRTNEVRIEESTRRKLTKEEQMDFDWLKSLEEWRSAYNGLSFKNEKEYQRLRKKYSKIKQSKFAQYTLPGEEPGSYRELVLRVPTKKLAKKGKIYKSSHWDEPNVIAHIRGDTRIIDGKKFFHIAEFQSDIYSRIAELEALEAEGQKGKEWAIVYSDGQDTGEWYTSEAEAQRAADDLNSERPTEYRVSVKHRPNKNARELANLKKLFPWGENWHELVSKKALEYAIRNGFDGISWDTAKTQVDRWESALRKSVDRINWSKAPDNQVWISGEKNKEFVFENMIPLQGETTINGQRITLNNLIGKDLANKIRESSETSGSFEGENLTIGGEFYKILYDQKIPGFLKKYGKKWGAKVGSSQVDTFAHLHKVVEETRGREAVRPQLVKVHTFDITPRMRQAIQTQGQAIMEPVSKYRQSEIDLAFGGKKKADEAIESVAKEIEAVSVSRRGMPDRGRVAKPKIAKVFRAKRRVDLTGRKLAKGNEAQEIAELFQVYRSPKMEILHSIYTAEDGTILGHNALTSGEINVVAPKDVAKYVYKMKSAAKRLGAAKIHTHHNHPSGNPAMSQNDKVFAARLHAELGDLMGEFVVIDHGKFTWVSKYERIRRGESYVTVEEGTYKVLPGTGEWMLKKGPKLTGPEAAAAFGDSLAYDKSKACFVYVDNGNNVVGWSTHDNTILKKSVPELEEILRQQAKAHDAIRTVIIAEDMALLEPIAEYGDAGDWLLDALDAKGESLREAVPMAFEVKRRPTKPARGLFEPESGYGKEKVIAIPPLKGQVEKILQAEADIGEVEKPIIERKKPLLTRAQKRLREKKKAIKEKQIKIENAEEAKKQVHAMIRNRRQNLNLATYETNLFINDIEKQTTKEQREVLPFIIEKTDIPKSLGRHDLEKIYKENKKDLSLIATQIKKHFDDSWQKMKENIPDMSAEQIEDYVTHIWDLNKKQKRIVTNWFITQNRFLKKRYIKTLKEGIEDIGLTPKTLDVGEIIRIHDSVVNRTIENKKFVKELKKLKFEGVSLVERADKAPKDWVYFDHPALKQGLVIPGKLKVGEKVSPELSNLLTDMGIAIGRRISPVAFGKTVRKTGEYKTGEPPEIRFQRFMSNRTIAHEIGHHLDNVLKLGKNFLNDYKSELYEINRERIEKFKGEKGKYNEAYARSTEEQIAEFFATLFTDASKAYKLAPNATADVLNRLKQDGTLSKLIDFDFEKQAKNLVEEQLNTMVKLPVKVHPDLEKPLKVIFDSRIEHPVIQAYEVVNGVLKKINLSLSLFHHGALGETGIATTGLRKTLNIYFNPAKIYKAMLQNKFDVFEKEPIARRWIKAGLQVGATADIPVNMIQDKLNNLARKTKNIPLINKTTKFISTFNETWDKALWNYLHDTLKLYACESLGTKIDPLKDITKQEQEIAQFVNDAFGGQNWDTLMVSPKTLQVMSWSLLSPDWTTSTVRQALAPTGIGRVYKETSGLRKKLGIYFWIKAGLYFGAGINMLNYAFRMYDEKKHPEYYEGMGKRTFLDRTMAGNAIGNKTRLFVGRYKDGSERYLRWGKQFRELPELFFDDTGFSPISATLKKVGGKLAPIVQLTSKIFTGTSPSGFKDDDIYGKRGWDYAYGIGKVLIKSPFPFATRALFQEGKEFHITDIAMPSSKGMTRWKAIDLFKHAIIKKDERFLKEVYQYTLMNNLPAYTLFSTALTILKAENTKEFNEGIKTIEEAEKALDKISNPKDLLRAQNRLNRITKENIDRKIGIDLLDTAIIDMEKYNTENNINFK